MRSLMRNALYIMRNGGVLSVGSRTRYPSSLTYYVLRMIGLDHHQRLAVLYGLGVLNQDTGDATRQFGLYWVHHLHGLDYAHLLAELPQVVRRDVRGLGGGGSPVEGARHGGHEQLL